MQMRAGYRAAAVWKPPLEPPRAHIDWTARGSCCGQAGTNSRSVLSTLRSIRRPPTGATSCWVDFTPADELHIKGLQNRYHQRGIGAPLAADATEAVKPTGFQVAPEVKVPVTALLRIDVSRRDLAQGHLRGKIDLYPAFEPSSVLIRGQSVPLEVDTSARHSPMASATRRSSSIRPPAITT